MEMERPTTGWGKSVLSKGKRKSSYNTNKVHFGTNGRLVLGNTLFSQMLTNIGVEPETNVSCACNADSIWRDDKEHIEAFLWFEIWKSKVEATQYVDDANEVRPLDHKRLIYQNRELMWGVHQDFCQELQTKGKTVNTKFKRFMWLPDEEIPMLKLDEPVTKERNGKETTFVNHPITRTDYTVESSAIDIAEDMGAIRIWLGEGVSVAEPRKHDNRKKK